jgi:hypothetical protein
MEYLVIVRAESGDQYAAQPVGIPELRAVAPTEEEAIHQVSASLVQWLASAKLVRVDVPIAGDGNPWLSTFGRSADDPDFDEFTEEMKQARLADLAAS